MKIFGRTQITVPTHGVDLQRVVVAVLVDVAEQRLPTQLVFTAVRHRQLHLGQDDLSDDFTWSIRESGSVGLGSCHEASGRLWR